MVRKDLLDCVPEIHPSAFVAKSADLIGAVNGAALPTNAVL